MKDPHLFLRALDPKADLDLFREIYNWRKHSSRLYPDKMSFEDFTSDDPSQIVMGLFNGSLCAAYLFREETRGSFDAHYSSRRGVSRNYVLAGGRWLVNWFMENGAQEVTAYVVEKNGPLRRFVEAVGFVSDGFVEFEGGQNDTEGGNVAPVRSFVKYAVRG